jgi:dihydrolipoamide dehydrogenase
LPSLKMSTTWQS